VCAAPPSSGRHPQTFTEAEPDGPPEIGLPLPGIRAEHAREEARKAARDPAKWLLWSEAVGGFGGLAQSSPTFRAHHSSPQTAKPRPHGRPLASISRTSSSVGGARPPLEALASNTEARLSRLPSTVVRGQWVVGLHKRCFSVSPSATRRGGSCVDQASSSGVLMFRMPGNADR
jgi:hypothetical protein